MRISTGPGRRPRPRRPRRPPDADRGARRRAAADLTFDPDREILLLDAPESIHPTVEKLAAGTAPANASPGRATIARETSRELVIDAEAADDGFLLLADMFYPGWHAQVDGVPDPDLSRQRQPSWDRSAERTTHGTLLVRAGALLPRSFDLADRSFATFRLVRRRRLRRHA
jgi:hypothetical protein